MKIENTYFINSISCWIIFNLHEFTLQAILLYFVVYKIYAKLYLKKRNKKYAVINKTPLTRNNKTETLQLLM